MKQEIKVIIFTNTTTKVKQKQFMLYSLSFLSVCLVPVVWLSLSALCGTQRVRCGWGQSPLRPCYLRYLTHLVVNKKKENWNNFFVPQFYQAHSITVRLCEKYFLQILTQPYTTVAEISVIWLDERGFRSFRSVLKSVEASIDCLICMWHLIC